MLSKFAKQSCSSELQPCCSEADLEEEEEEVIFNEDNSEENNGGYRIVFMVRRERLLFYGTL